MQSHSEREDAFYADVGKMIKKYRVQAGFTQAELASRIEMTRSSVANIEAGRQRFPLHVLAQLSEILDSQPSVLIPAKSYFTASAALSKETHAELDEISSTARRFVENAILGSRRP